MPPCLKHPSPEGGCSSVLATECLSRRKKSPNQKQWLTTRVVTPSSKEAVQDETTRVVILGDQTTTSTLVFFLVCAIMTVFPDRGWLRMVDENTQANKYRKHANYVTKVRMTHEAFKFPAYHPKAMKRSSLYYVVVRRLLAIHRQLVSEISDTPWRLAKGRFKSTKAQRHTSNSFWTPPSLAICNGQQQ